MKKLLVFAIGPVVAALLGLVTVPILTRIVTPEIYGKISLAQVTIQFFLMIIFSGYEQAYTREFYSEVKISKLFSNTFFVSAFIFCILILASLLFSGSISEMLFDMNNKSILLIVITTSFLLAILKYIQIYFRMNKQAVHFSASLATRAIVNFLFIVGFYYYFETFGLLEYLIIQLASIIITILVLVLFVNKTDFYLSRTAFDLVYFKSLSKFALPLLISSVLMWILYSVDQVMLKYLANFRELGIYSSAYRICSAMILMQTIICSYWLPLALKWYKDNTDIKCYEAIGNIIALILFLIFSIILYFRDFIVLLLGNDFSDSLSVFPYLLLYPILYTLSEVCSVGIIFRRKTKYLVIITFMSASLNIALNYYLIPQIGAKGAAISTAVTFSLYFYLRIFYANYIWNKTKTTLITLSLFACAILLYLNSISFNYLDFAIMFVCLIFVLLLLYQILSARRDGILLKVNSF